MYDSLLPSKYVYCTMYESPAKNWPCMFRGTTTSAKSSMRQTSTLPEPSSTIERRDGCARGGDQWAGWERAGSGRARVILRSKGRGLVRFKARAGRREEAAGSGAVGAPWP